MRRYKYYIGGLEYMAKFIIRFRDGTELPLENATMAQVSMAVSIIRIADIEITG